MPELRWILLVLGALLVCWLWWWELRRSRQPAPPAIPAIDHATRGADRFESRVDATASELADAQPPRAPEERTIPRDPPVVTLPDLPVDADQVVLAREPAASRRTESTLPAARREPVAPDSWLQEAVIVDFGAAPPARADDSFGRARSSGGSASQAQVPAEILRASDPVRAESPRVEPRFRDAPASEARGPVPRAPFGRREPSIDTSADADDAAPPPVLETASIATASRGASVLPAVGAGGIEARRPAPRPAVAPRPTPPPEPPKPAPAAEPPSSLQRIVAIRLVAADAALFDGGALRAALEAEGLRFGKYSIFHRQRADGRALYSIASLVEPGSFDVDRMHELEFPGVSMFAVFPGPLDAPDVFDELLATARRLAERLDGLLQDERGGPLSAQRVLGIREELVSFQNLVSRVRSRPAG